jgi:hypothetical protein
MPPDRPSDHRLILSGATPLAVGHLRQIFDDPRDPAQVIKIMRADAVEARWGAAARWYKRLPLPLHYTGHVRELKEYISREARHPGRAPIAHMIGVVETDLGLGLVAEKVRGPDGRLAPTLAERYQNERGFSPALERDLAEFLDALLESQVIVGDLHAWNIVYGSDSRGGPRFVLIDGFGEKRVIPLTSMSDWYNRRNTRRLYRRMREQLVTLVPL